MSWMRDWYASTPSRRTRQVVGDLLVLTWVALALWLADVVRDTFGALAGHVR